MTKNQTMSIEERQLFTRLNELFSFIGLDELYGRYRNFIRNSDVVEEEILQSHPNIDPIDFMESSYTYDEETGLRTWQSYSENGVMVSTESFDDDILAIISFEKDKIIRGLREIKRSCPTMYSWQNNSKDLLSEYTHTLESFDKFEFPYLSEDFSDKALSILNEIGSGFTDLGVKYVSPGSYDEVSPSSSPTKSLIAEQNPAKIRKLYKALKKGGFIVDKDDKSELFVNVLSGKDFPQADQRINWDNMDALKFFIQQIEVHKYPGNGRRPEMFAFTLPTKKWKWAKKIFTNKDNTDFYYLSNAKTPAKETQLKIQGILKGLKL
jgi:hypothetical protein